MDHRPKYVSMAVGQRRVITPLADVVSVLDLAPRTFPEGADIPTVSLVGAWSCTGSSQDVVSWFQSKSVLRDLHHGRDVFGDFSGDPALLYAHVLAAVALLETSTSASAIFACKVLEPAVAPFRPPVPPSKAPAPPARPVTRRPSVSFDKDGRLVLPLDAPIPPPSKGTALEHLARFRAETARPVPPMHVHYKAPVEPPVPPQLPPVESSPDEPWAEAFDFGRLVPVENRDIGGNVQPTVSARDVHTFLESGRDFTSWVKGQSDRCSLVEGTDFQKINSPKNGVIVRRGRVAVDYAFTLVGAKKVAMAAPGSRGAAVREYFIECERRLLAGEGPIPASVDPMLPPPVQAPAAPPASSWQPSVVPSRASQLSMPDIHLPLTMLDFLIVNGFGLDESRVMATRHEPLLLERMRADGEGAYVRRHPVSGMIVFARPILDGWWETTAPSILPGLSYRA